MKTVYTAILGHYEELKEPTVITPNWRYICYTDQPFTSNVWEIRKIEPQQNTQRQAREIKIMFHNYVDTQYSLWLDGSFQINTDLNSFWDRAFKTPFSCPSHPIRNDVFMEIQSCLANRRGDANELLEQEAKYKKLGLPRFNGIITSGVLLREKTEGCIALCEAWHKELTENSSRDQIAFARVSIGKKFHTFQWDYSQSREIKHFKHFQHRH